MNDIQFSGTEKFMRLFGDVVYNYYLSKFVNKPRYYAVRPNKVEDLQRFCFNQMLNPEVNKLSEQFYGSDMDEIAINVLRYVRKYMTYISDKTVWKVPEYWQNVEETIKKRTGDCEDGAILILTLCRLAGIPSNRIFLRCGDVVGGGHAYVVYRANNGKLYTLDWCYYYSGVSIKYRKTIDESKYLTKWFDVNDSGCWK